MPMMLKGPTGCGKTRFVEYMAWKLGRPAGDHVACNEDMTASDLVGRYLLDARRDRLARRSADYRRAARRHLLPRRGGRGPAGHHRGHPPADRCAAHAAAGQEGRTAAGTP
jgi:MoxR-like ATPase